jgi:predicted alpha/beta superfamily hydrolase
MKKWGLSLILIVCLLSACTSQEAAAPGPEVEEEPGQAAAIIPLSAMHVVPSQYFEEDFLISVGMPLSYGMSEATYPVLYMLDGNIEFGIGASLAPLLAYGQEAPEVIVVGIGYVVSDIMQIVQLRTRDLPPTATEEGGGGADNLIKFIEEELKPFIEENYRADPESEILFGHSLGGLFTTYVLFQNPEAFDRYIIGSPSYDWDNNVAFTFEEDFAAANNDLPARVFMGVGGMEGDLYADAEAMVQLLIDRNYPNLDLELYVYDEGMHFSTLGGTIGQGLMAVLSNP